MTRLSRSALVLLLGAAAACRGGDEPEPLPVPPPDMPHTDATRTDTPDVLQPLPPESIPVRPATLTDTISIEGSPEPVRATLVRSAEGFRLPFSTYVPDDMRVEMRRADGAAAVRFTAAFGGTPQPLAYMYVHMYEPGVSLEQVRQQVGGILRSLFPQDDPVDVGRLDETWQSADPPAWALEAYRFDYPRAPRERYVGRVTIARHGGAFLHVLTHYPAEFGDGMGPRISYILSRWRWEDTGRLLESPDLAP